jgi:tellurite resistance protein
MSTELPSEGFVAIAAVAWADGRMSKDEAAGLLRAAKECGLSGDDLAKVEKAAKEKTGLDAFDPAALSPIQKALVYAIASWISRIDGVMQTAERESLKQLGSRLGLSADKLASAAAGAADIAVLPQGNRPDKYDFTALANRLRERLPSLLK